ncbi:MAG TPA: DMT family transporter [Pseudonocardiaceae bacterium]|nr:DMT family transporter [Pseudonocardiaceae bacterium]
MVTAYVERTPRRIWPRGVLAALAGRGLGSVPPPALVLAGIVSVQVGASLAKQLFPIAGAVGVVTLRLVFAAVILLIAWRPSLRMTRQAWLVVAMFGTVLGVMNVAFYESINRIPLGVAVTIEFLGPLALALVGSRRWLDGLWALLAGGGVVLLTDGGGPVVWTGVLFALGAAACWACYILLSARLGAQTSGGGGLAIAMAIGGMLVAPFGVVSAGTDLLRPEVLAAGFGVALLSSVVPYSVELEALRSIPPRVFGVLMSLEPAVAALCGLVVLSQSLHPVQWIAVCLVVAASVGATRTDKPAPPTAEV